jgi:hypothetical protein
MKSRLARGIALGIFPAALAVRPLAGCGSQEKDLRGRILADRICVCPSEGEGTLREGSTPPAIPRSGSATSIPSSG